jgi:hypothetical protein
MFRIGKIDVAESNSSDSFQKGDDLLRHRISCRGHGWGASPARTPGSSAGPGLGRLISPPSLPPSDGTRSPGHSCRSSTRSWPARRSHDLAQDRLHHF